MDPKLFDVHTHVQVSQFNKDRYEVIKRALKENIWMINVGDDKKTSIDAVELTEKYPEGVFASIGQHPTRKEIFDYELYKKLAQNNKVVAIGECGLEYYERNGKVINNAEKERQKQLFLEQIKLSNETNKPLMIHCREAFGDLIEILNSYFLIHNSSQPPGIIHFFTGSLSDAQALLKLGFYFTFGGLITYNRSFDEIIKFLPLEKIMVETDAPYVAPAPYRGKRNEPAYVIEVAKKLAEIKGISFEEVCEQTTENVKKVFNL
ncbi:MAG: TatD family hydrolase [Patescibacteria group bacterium]|mgnify:CR=1 FL=1